MIVSNGNTRPREPDFSVENHGSVALVRPQTRAAKQWCGAHLPDGALTWGRAFVVEPRYLAGILRGIVDDGLTVQI